MIVYIAHVNGFGDKLLGIVSSYMLSVILNKKFRIYWEMPFPISDILHSHKNDNEKIEWDKKDYNVTFCDMFTNNPEVFKDQIVVISENSNEDVLNKIRSTFNNNNQESDNREIYVDCIYPYYIYLYTHYKSYFPEISSIDQVISVIFAKLFVIPKSISKKLISGHRTLGVQIRSLHRISMDYPKISGKCITRFLNAIGYLCKSKGYDKVYLSSDSDHILSIFPKGEFKMATDSHESNGSEISEISDGNDGSEESKYTMVEFIRSDGESKHIFYEEFTKNIDKIKIIVDILNLSKCDGLLISHWSNFGRISSLLSGNDPYIVKLDIDLTCEGTKQWYAEKIRDGITDYDKAFGVEFGEDFGEECKKYPLEKLLSKSSI